MANGATAVDQGEGAWSLFAVRLTQTILLVIPKCGLTCNYGGKSSANKFVYFAYCGENIWSFLEEFMFFRQLFKKCIFTT